MSRGQAPAIKSSSLSGEVDERALRLSVALAFIRWRASGREDFLDAAEELGVDPAPLALSLWILFGRTRAGRGDLDDASIRAVLRFCRQILSPAVAASPRDAI